MSAWLAEHVAERASPQWLKRRYWRLRQYWTFVRGDGVTDARAPPWRRRISRRSPPSSRCSRRRPFVLGQRPTEADFGFFASLFRHFFSDPAPGAHHARAGPRRAGVGGADVESAAGALRRVPLPERVPDDLGALFDAITRVYLPYLEANAAAYASGEKRVRYEVRGTTFVEPSSPTACGAATGSSSGSPRSTRRRGRGRARARLERSRRAVGRAVAQAGRERDRFAPVDAVARVRERSTAGGERTPADVSVPIRILTANLCSGRADPVASLRDHRGARRRRDLCSGARPAARRCAGEDSASGEARPQRDQPGPGHRVPPRRRGRAVRAAGARWLGGPPITRELAPDSPSRSRS